MTADVLVHIRANQITLTLSSLFEAPTSRTVSFRTEEKTRRKQEDSTPPTSDVINPDSQ